LNQSFLRLKAASTEEVLAAYAEDLAGWMPHHTHFSRAVDEVRGMASPPLISPPLVYFSDQAVPVARLPAWATLRICRSLQRADSACARPAQPQTASMHFLPSSFRLHVIVLAAFVVPISGQPTASAVPDEPAILLDPFTVSTENDVGYSSTHSLGASRMNVDLRDTPMSIITLNESFLQDIGLLNTTEALQYVSNAAPNETGLNEIFTLRGNIVSGSQRDGLPEPSGPGASVNNSLLDPVFYQRLEIIKGPAGTMYGTQSLGGVVNRVSKAPLFDSDIASLQLTVGDFSMIRAVVDYGTRSPGGNVAIRVIGLFQDAETIPGDHDNRRQIAPMFAYRNASGGKAWLTTHYAENQTMTGTAPWFIDSAGNISTSFNRRFSYNQNDARNEDSRFFLETGFQQNFSLFGETWSARLVARHNRVKFEDRLYNPRTVQFFNGAGAVIPGGTLASNYSDVRITAWTVRDQVEDLDNLGAFLDVTGTLKTGPVEHQLITYFQHQTTDKYIRRVTNNWKPMSYLYPVYEANPEQFRINPVDAVALDNDSTQETYAWGIQNNAALFGGRLNLVAGARHDYVLDSLQDRRNRVFYNNQSNRNWLYSYGATLDLTAGVTLFALHSETFQPQGGTDDLGRAVPNRDGKNDEVGVKLVLFDGKFSATASYFDMAETNILELTFIPELNVALSLPAGDRTTKGWEADLRYQPFRNLNLLFAMGELDAVSSNGSLGRNVPQDFNYSGFIKYDFLTGPLQRLGVGTGYVYTSKRSVEGAANRLMPGNHEWNGVVTYRLSRNWRFHLAVNNIDDTRAARSSALNARIMPVAPRSFRFTTTYTF
jgi:iron complex outermembrane recepter protein